MTETTLPQYTGQPTIVEFLNARLLEAEGGWRGHKWQEDEGIIEPSFHFGQSLVDEMLEEIAVKRKLWEIHDVAWNAEVCTVCHRLPDGGELEQERWPCPTIRVLAAIYAQHPDYREEWAV